MKTLEFHIKRAMNVINRGKEDGYLNIKTFGQNDTDIRYENLNTFINKSDRNMGLVRHGNKTYLLLKENGTLLEKVGSNPNYTAYYDLKVKTNHKEITPGFSGKVLGASKAEWPEHIEVYS